MSIISNEVDDVEEESEQIQYSILDKNLFGIRRRRTKIIEKAKLVDNIETAKDALEDVNQKSYGLEAATCECSEIEPLKTRDKIKYTMFVLFGITGCYLSYKLVPMYIVSKSILFL